jgi:hypothetical protein
MHSSIPYDPFLSSLQNLSFSPDNRYRWQRLQGRAFDGPVCTWPTSQGKLHWTSRSECTTSSSTHHLPHADHRATNGYQLAGQHLHSFLNYTYYDIFRALVLWQSHRPFHPPLSIAGKKKQESAAIMVLAVETHSFNSVATSSKLSLFEILGLPPTNPF